MIGGKLCFPRVLFPTLHIFPQQTPQQIAQGPIDNFNLPVNFRMIGTTKVQMVVDHLSQAASKVAKKSGIVVRHDGC